MKIYHMVIENLKTKERRVFMNQHQGSAPQGWRCVSVCGYHEKPSTKEDKE